MGVTLTKANGDRTQSSGSLAVDPLRVDEYGSGKSHALLRAYESLLLDQLNAREEPVFDPWTLLQAPSGDVPKRWPISDMLDYIVRFGARPNETLGPDVEQDVMADFRPRTHMRFQARIRSIQGASADLGLSDADWQGLNLSDEDV